MLRWGKAQKGRVQGWLHRGNVGKQPRLVTHCRPLTSIQNSSRQRPKAFPTRACRLLQADPESPQATPGLQGPGLPAVEDQVGKWALACHFCSLVLPLGSNSRQFSWGQS